MGQLDSLLRKHTPEYRTHSLAGTPRDCCVAAIIFHVQAGGDGAGVIYGQPSLRCAVYKWAQKNVVELVDFDII